MDLPYVESGILHIENASFPLKNFCYEAMLELIPPDKKLSIYLDYGSNQVGFAFPNSTGIIRAYFLYESKEFNKEGKYFEFSGMQFTEIHFQLYEPVYLDILMAKQKRSQAQLLDSEDKKLAAFSRCYLAEIESDMVKCLWFINPEIITKNDDPLYIMLRENFK